LKLLLAVLAPVCFASTDQLDSSVAKAEKLSSLTGPAAEPFHLKFTISEPANQKSPYTATVEEYWKSGNDWTRSIDSLLFQKNVVVKDISKICMKVLRQRRAPGRSTIEPVEDRHLLLLKSPY
jgi:hypothetical protein